jgi:hypothetical protein
MTYSPMAGITAALARELGVLGGRHVHGTAGRGPARGGDEKTP